MKRKYEKLTMAPLGVEPAEDILLNGSVTAQKGMVSVHPYEEGFAGVDGATSFGDKSFSDVSF